jgi:hypothetical protein
LNKSDVVSHNAHLMPIPVAVINRFCVVATRDLSHVFRLDQIDAMLIGNEQIREELVGVVAVSAPDVLCNAD